MRRANACVEVRTRMATHHTPSRANFQADFLGNSESVTAERCAYATILVVCANNPPLGSETLGSEIQPRGCVNRVIYYHSDPK